MANAKGALQMLQEALERIALHRPVTQDAVQKATAAVESGVHPLYAAAEATGLDMSPAARLRRAAEQGYSRPGFHGTHADFEKFDISKGRDSTKAIHAADAPEAATYRLGYTREFDNEAGDYGDWFHEADNAKYHPEIYGPKENFDRYLTEQYGGANVMPLVFQMNNPVELPDLGHWNPDSLLRELRDRGLLSNEELSGLVGGPRDTTTKAFDDALRRAGHDGVEYINAAERDWSVEFDPESAPDSFFVRNPDQVRSSHAAFDPANKGTGYLMGSKPLATSTAGGLTLYQMYKDKQRGK